MVLLKEINEIGKQYMKRNDMKIRDDTENFFWQIRMMGNEKSESLIQKMSAILS